MIYVKEKILLIGGSNCGKTHAMLRFAQNIIDAGNRAFIIDADDGALKLIAEMDEFKLLREALDSPVFQLMPVYDYEGMKAAADYYRHHFKPKQGDLIGGEMINNAWDWAQARYAADVKQATMAEIAKDIQEDGKRLQFGGLDGRSEWPVIKGMYFDITTPMLQSPAHVIWTASAKPLLPGMEKADVQELFGSVGMRNDGQKDVHYKVDTLFYLDYKRATGQRTWTTLKERGRREKLANIPYNDLFTEYYTLHDLTPPWGEAA